nr:polysaccharide pyruvyl transferase family protein [uncultured Anaerobutyricum sp.]
MLVNLYKLRKNILKTGIVGRMLKVPYMAIKNYKLQHRADYEMNKIINSVVNCKKCILYLDIPIHPNMGDLAQYCCIKDWIKKNYSEYELFEIDADVILRSKNRFLDLLKELEENDLIFFQSGYCTQDLGGTHDEVHRFVVDNAKNIPIIMLQQTILYNNPDNARRTSISYAAHKKLMIIARDKQSYEYAKNLFPNNSLGLLPDFVTSWIGTRHCMEREQRKGILVCCRNDSERYYSEKEINELVKQLSKIDKVTISDTTIQCDFYQLKSNIEKNVNEMIANFGKYRAVVTDRYHGTIFSLIAGTPVIVIKTNDHKVVTGVDWFRDVYEKDTVCYEDNISLVSEHIKKIYRTYSYKNLEPYFNDKYYISLKKTIEDWRNK